jgi:hypothetical protein
MTGRRSAGVKEMTGLRRCSILCLLALLGAAPLQAGVIVGETINIRWLFPNEATVLTSSGDVVVADPGVEWVPGLGVGDVDVGEGFITIENLTMGWTASQGFNGFTFTDVFGTIPHFTSFSLVSIEGFPPAVDPILSFTPDVLSVNFNASNTSNLGEGTGALYTFAFTTVPEPTTMALLGIGLVVGWVSRNRRN